ncbi:LOW QUALITY PROTEIN: HCLS1-binding protein 3 [Colossoma macropomum]|uniref:LOW QUALITY PROTEIN: HCLS1-binding protein 3 n=1 Tax=Colossoma macropomum TaxID=42526 RepID=UPI0018648E91|nr:LOW QUALITY PROTEIN: HCLS1-binding protein 3 [Colossoma macropomum]
MPDGLITSRPLQNEATGIDLQVPQYQEIRGPMMTGHVEYQIVVVTRLAAFKSAKHKPGDVVQLVVSKKYSEIDEFCHNLVAQYPSIHLPAMPRKALFVGETDIRERRAAFDELVRFIAKHPTLSTCPELLEFLGAKSNVRDVTSSNSPDWLVEEDDDGLDFFGKENEASTTQTDRVKKPAKAVKPTQEEEEDEEELFDPLGGVRSKKPKPVQPVPKPAPTPKLSLFDEEDDPDKELFQPAVKDSNLRLFEDPDLGGPVTVGDTLLLSNAYQKSAASAAPKLDEDVDELFRVEEDLDKLLAISKPVRPKPAIAPKPKPALKPKPAVPQKPPSLAQASGAAPQSGTAQAMDQLDILKYIQQNEAAVSEDLDLF